MNACRFIIIGVYVSVSVRIYHFFLTCVGRVRSELHLTSAEFLASLSTHYNLRPTRSLLVSLFLSGFDINQDYPQRIWYFYQGWQQSLRPEQVPLGIKTDTLDNLDNVKDMQVSLSMREAILEGFWEMYLSFQCWPSRANTKLTNWSPLTVNNT